MASSSAVRRARSIRRFSRFAVPDQIRCCTHAPLSCSEACIALITDPEPQADRKRDRKGDQ